MDKKKDFEIDDAFSLTGEKYFEGRDEAEPEREPEASGESDGASSEGQGVKARLGSDGDIEIKTLSKPLPPTTRGAMRDTMGGPDWWVAMENRPFVDQGAEPGPLPRVETSGLIYLSRVAEKIRQQEESRLKEDQARRPITISPPVPTIETGPARPHRLKFVLALAGGCVFGVAIAAVGFWAWGPDKKAGSREKNVQASATTPETAQRAPSRSTSRHPAARRRATRQHAAAREDQIQPETPERSGMEPEVVDPGETLEPGEDSRRSRRRRRSRRSRSRDDEEQARQTDAVAALLRKVRQSGSPGEAGGPARDAKGSETARGAAARPSESRAGDAGKTDGKTAARTPAAAGRDAPATSRDKTLPGSLLSGSRGKADKPAASKLPKRLTRKQIARKLGGARRRAQACLRQYGYYKQTIRVQLTIRGATGRIVAARALGRYKGTPVGKCGERAVKRVRFSRFSDANQVYTLVAIVTR